MEITLLNKMLMREHMGTECLISKERRAIVNANKKANEDYQKAVGYLSSINLEASFEVVDENPNFDSKEKFNFLITLSNGGAKQSFPFSQSCKNPMQRGHYKYLVTKLKVENQYPDLLSLLNCLVMDSDCLNYTFDDWCDDLGYDQDSIKAKQAYDICIKQAIECKSLFDIEEVRQYLEDNDLN